MLQEGRTITVASTDPDVDYRVRVERIGRLGGSVPLEDEKASVKAALIRSAEIRGSARISGMGLGPRKRAGAGFDADGLGARRQPIVDKTVGVMALVAEEEARAIYFDHGSDAPFAMTSWERQYRNDRASTAVWVEILLFAPRRVWLVGCRTGAAPQLFQSPTHGSDRSGFGARGRRVLGSRCAAATSAGDAPANRSVPASMARPSDGASRRDTPAGDVTRCAGSVPGGWRRRWR